jgi:GDP-L-fucose synthase
MVIVVTGAAGFLGRHTMAVLRRHYAGEQVLGVTRGEFDLTDPVAVRGLFATHRPDVVVHLAGYVGGIGANRSYPADFYYRNTLLTALMFEGAARAGVRKLIYAMGGCSYPAAASSPIGEDQMWAGYPQPESAPYSTAKKMGLVASEAYRRQYGLDSSVLVPGNMYGEYDNFRPAESHVVPALIRRFHEAKRGGVGEMMAWGTGRPIRDFVYARDVAELIPWAIEEYHSSEPLNLSSGTRTSIKELTEMIARLTRYEGKVIWDSSKPDGQMVKIFDVSRMRSKGLECPTPLEDGLERTIRWFETHFGAGTDGIRL